MQQFAESEQELVQIIDEIASAAASIPQGAHNYDNFIRARESCIEKLHEHFERKREISSVIKQLYKLL